jgi:hypothetical protein
MVISRRSLEDLYQTGEMVDVSPAQDGSVEVFIRKMGPSQQQTAVRKANAARIRVKQLANREEDDDQKLVILEEVDKLTPEDQITYLTEVEIASEKEKIEQELSEEEEWAEDGRLQALVDAWEDGLLEEWLKGEGERSQESEDVFNEMKRFADAVEEKMKARRDNARADIEEMTEEEIYQKVLDNYIDREAGLTWIKVFREYQILFGVEDPETHEKIYDNIEQVEMLPNELWAHYLAGIDRLTVPSLDLKS